MTESTPLLGPHYFEPLQPTIYTGTFIHCSSLRELVVNRGSVCVDERGRIVYTDFVRLDEGDVPHAWKTRKTDEERGGNGISNGNGCRKSLTVRELTELVGWNKKMVRVVTGEGREGEGFWFPGFVDTHIHASQYPNCGLFGTTTLLSWLQHYTFPIESLLSSPEHAYTVYASCVSRTLAHGTTTASYFTSISSLTTNLLASLCLSFGQRAFLGRCNMDNDLQPVDYRDESVESAVNLTKETISYCQRVDPDERLIAPIVTPRFAPSCSPELLAALGNLVGSSDAEACPLRVQTHLAETLPELAVVRSKFPSSKSYTHLYASNDLLTQRTVLAHCIHLSESEMNLIKKFGAGVSHCPASNSALGSGLCRVGELLARGIKVGLGTDVSGGYSVSMLEATKQAVLVSRLVGYLETRSSQDPLRTQDGSRPPPNARDQAGGKEKLRQAKAEHAKLSVPEALHLATRGGAACLNLENEIGAFEVGMQFDAQYISLSSSVANSKQTSRETFHPQPTSLPCHFTASGGHVPPVLGLGNVQLFDFDHTAGNESVGRETWRERLEKWVFTGDDRNTRAVFVRGRPVCEKEEWNAGKIVTNRSEMIQSEL